MPMVAAELGRPIGVHIGIASGEVMASGTGSARHLEYTVTGESGGTGLSGGTSDAVTKTAEAVAGLLGGAAVR